MTASWNPELDALFARLPRLDSGQCLALAAACRAEDPAREDAWAAVRTVVANGHLERDLDRVRSEVAAWATRLGGGAISPREDGFDPSELLMADARRAAAYAVLDAAVALLLGPRLPEPHRAALLRPWKSVAAG